MLTIEQIENEDYSTNDIADLKMRLDIAIETLKTAGGVTFFEKNEAASEIQSVTELGLARILRGHSDNCPKDVVRMNGEYCCGCELRLEF